MSRLTPRPAPNRTAEIDPRASGTASAMPSIRSRASPTCRGSENSPLSGRFVPPICKPAAASRRCRQEVFDHGSAPRIARGSLWQAKQRPPSTSFSCGSSSPSPPCSRSRRSRSGGAARVPRDELDHRHAGSPPFRSRSMFAARNSRVQVRFRHTGSPQPGTVVRLTTRGLARPNRAHRTAENMTGVRTSDPGERPPEFAPVRGLALVGLHAGAATAIALPWAGRASSGREVGRPPPPGRGCRQEATAPASATTKRKATRPHDLVIVPFQVWNTWTANPLHANLPTLCRERDVQSTSQRAPRRVW